MTPQEADLTSLAVLLEMIVDRLDKLEVQVRGLVTSQTVEAKEFVVKDDRGDIRAQLDPFQKVLRAAGIRKVRPHDLRHTYATLAIEAGVPLLAVSRQFGHASISITADVYAHAVPGGNPAAAEVMEAVLSNQTHPPRNLPA